LPLEEQLKFVIILNSISFCFWKTPKWTINYKNRCYDGSWGMIIVIAKAIENGTDILSFDFLSNLNEKEFNLLIEDESRLTYRSERINILRNFAINMKSNFDSNPLHLLEYCDFDALKLVDYLTITFEMFKDQATYNNKIVYFNKRAQLMAADLSHVLETNNKPQLVNNNKITACADYKIPFILREFNILSYSSELDNQIKSRNIIPQGEKYEMEIRAYTIWAVELIKNEYQKNGINYKSTEINDFLWLLSQIKNPNYSNYHLTETISY
jgi:hypothetical protein